MKDNFIVIEEQSPFIADKGLDFNKINKELPFLKTVIVKSNITLNDFYHLMILCDSNGVSVLSKVNFFDPFLNARPVKYGEDYYSEYFLNDITESFSYKYIKRFIDLTLSLAGIILTVVLTPFIWLAIKKENKNLPLFYFQERLGQGGIPFKMVKFNTMIINAEETGPVWTKKNDERVTKTGKFLRRFALDELPQFFSVLAGRMSVIGPRPERSYFYLKYPEIRGLRLSVLPGITGYAQIKLRDPATENNLKLKLAYDIYYIKNFSLFLDIKILYNTVLTIMKGRDF